MLNIPALEQQVTELMVQYKIPGLSLAVVHESQVVYASGFGVTSVEEHGITVTPRTLFRIGSTTKPLTGTAIMRLVESGRLDLDTPVGRYMPELKFSRPGAEQEITLRMLLTHTSGLDCQNNPYGSRDPEAGERFLLDLLPRVPFAAEPGTLKIYSNPGFALAACIAARVYGKPVAAMVRELVFAPLSMERSTFDPLDALTYPFALSHNLRPDGTLEVARPVVESTGMHGAGFAMSTVLDMAKFAIMQMDGAGPLQEMHRMQAPHYTVDGAGYGIAFTVSAYKGLKRVGQGGGIHSYHCSFDMLPEARTAVIIMASRPAPPGVHLKLINDCFDQVLDLPAELPAAPEPVDIAPGPAFAGLYLSRLSGLLTVSVTAEGLTLEMMGRSTPLKAYSPTIYFGPRPDGQGIRSVGFIQAEPGQPCRYVMVDGSSAVRFDPDPGFVPDKDLLERYAGTYLAPPHGREDVRLWVGDDGRLWGSFAWYPGQAFPCTPLNSDTHFASGGGSFVMNEGALEINGWKLPKAGT
ncbi:MAG TPA: serine hydrolase [Symbiobacteriaceae bacterium]|nr:serine hydrolase [Symbiobacteriaceae bacterium]